MPDIELIFHDIQETFLLKCRALHEREILHGLLLKDFIPSEYTVGSENIGSFPPLLTTRQLCGTTL